MSEALRRPIRRNPRLGHAVGRTARCFTQRTYGLGADRHHAASLGWKRIHRPRHAPPGNPYDGHTLATVIPEIETQIGASVARIVPDQRLSRPQPPRRPQVLGLSGQRRRVIQDDQTRVSAVSDFSRQPKGLPVWRRG